MLAGGADVGAVGGPILGALIDPVGIIDRAMAEQELTGLFEIIDDGHVGPRAPNQVTRAEYQEIARRFSDIRLGRTDIEIDGSAAADPDRFKADMMSDIADLLQTHSGRELVGTLADNTYGVDAAGEPIHRKTMLAPRLDERGAPDSSDATTTEYLSGPDVGNAGVSINPGTDVTTRAGGVLRSDVALYHELAHALSITQQTLDGRVVDASDDALREMMRLDLGGAIGALARPDSGVAYDAAHDVGRHEHQAAGLGLYADGSLTENAYRRERRQVTAGERRHGDATMDQRDRYEDYRGTYHP